MPDTPYGRAVKAEIALWFEYLDFVHDSVHVNGPPANGKAFAASPLSAYALGSQPTVQNTFRFAFKQRFRLPAPDSAFGQRSILAFVDDISAPESLASLLARLYGYVWDPQTPLLSDAAESKVLSAFPDLSALRQEIFGTLPDDFQDPTAFDPALTVAQSIAKLLP